LPRPELSPALAWESGASLSLGPEFGSIQLSGSNGVIPKGWEVGSLRNGSRMKLHASGPRRKLIDLLRERGIPPWLRHAVPVLYWNGAAVSLGDCVMEPGLLGWLDEHDASLHWHPIHPLLRKLKSVSVQPAERNNMSYE